MLAEQKQEDLAWLQVALTNIVAERWAWELAGAARREIEKAQNIEDDYSTPVDLDEAPSIGKL